MLGALRTMPATLAPAALCTRVFSVSSGYIMRVVLPLASPPANAACMSSFFVLPFWTGGPAATSSITLQHWPEPPHSACDAHASPMRIICAGVASPLLWHHCTDTVSMGEGWPRVQQPGSCGVHCFDSLCMRLASTWNSVLVPTHTRDNALEQLDRGSGRGCLLGVARLCEGLEIGSLHPGLTWSCSPLIFFDPPGECSPGTEGIAGQASPNGTIVAASNQAMLGSASRSLASGSSIMKFLNLP